MIANYDLREQLCSGDFYGWLVEWATKGASEIVFDTREFRPGWPEGVARRRFETMLAPAPAFLGLPSREGSDGERVGPRSKTQTLVRFSNDNKTFKRMRSVLPAQSFRYTVSLRAAEQDVFRNSDREAWLQFADEIGALVIEDYVLKPYDLLDLMAIYAGAKMNFGVLSSPMMLCSLSEYPCMMFNLRRHSWFLAKSNLYDGDAMPWCAGNQLAFWDDDSYDNILWRFEQWAS